jgi:hypothetical protein
MIPLDPALASTPWYVSPEWWTALLTGGLLLVTAATAIFGLRVANAARSTYRLESAPVILVTKATSRPIHAEDYVVTLSGRAVTLRQRAHDLDEPMLRLSGSTSSPHYGGRPQWNTTVLELSNVGRSPAIRPEINLRCSLTPHKAPAASAPARSSEDPPWLAGRDYPHPLQRVTVITAIVTVPVIPAGEKAYITIEKIENRIGADLGIEIASETDARSQSAIIDGINQRD